MKLKIYLSLGSFLLLFSACDIKPVEINYGKDACHYCTMTIVDNQHAAELLNDKGKAFKYDAIECMLNDIKRRSESEIGMILVNDYNNPGNLVIAEEATYLVSEAIPSPMGAFLSAGIDQNKIVALKTENGGAIFSWETIKREFKVDN